MHPDSEKQPDNDPQGSRWTTENELQVRMDPAGNPSLPNLPQPSPSQPSPAAGSPALGTAAQSSAGPQIETIGNDANQAYPQSTLIFHRIPADSHQPIEPPPVASVAADIAETNSSKTTTLNQPKGSQSKARTRSQTSHPNPITQSLMLLFTMGFMLAAARFAVPTIVEEIRYAWHRGELRAEYETGTEGLQNVSLDALSEAYQMVTSAVAPSVVHIEVDRSVTTGGLLASQARGHGLPSSDQGSGVVVDDAGFIVTNRHVIADGKTISVTLSDGRQVQAIVVGMDPLTDLAVLKIDATGLMPIAWGDSERCRVGSPVWAIGSPFGLDRTITFGILSGKHRMVRASTRYQDFMQSDVAVNPGNSGGPLVDARGTLIGINTAIVGDTYQGVSFSIPSSVVKKVYLHLRETGRVDRGWLGVALSEVPDDQMVGENHRVRGALVTAIAEENSPAALAGVQAGDVITEVNGATIRDMGHVMREIWQRACRINRPTEGAS